MRIPWPFRGIDENWSYENQIPATTRSAKNCRSTDPATGRKTGAQRAGTSKYLALQPNGANPVQAMAHVVTADDNISFADVDPPTEDWATGLKHGPSGNGIAARSVATVASDGRVYIYSNDPDKIITRVNPSGAVELIVDISQNLPGGTNYPLDITAIHVRSDDDENERFIYVSSEGHFSAGDGKLLKYREFGGGIELVWEKEVSGTFGESWAVRDFDVLDFESTGGTTTIRMLAAVITNEQAGTVELVLFNDNGSAITETGRIPIDSGAHQVSIVSRSIVIVSSTATWGGSPGMRRYAYDNVAKSWVQRWSFSKYGEQGTVVSVSGGIVTIWAAMRARGGTNHVVTMFTDVLDVASTNQPTSAWNYITAGGVARFPVVDDAGNVYFILETSAGATSVVRLDSSGSLNWNYDPGFTGMLRGVTLETRYGDGETVPEFMYSVADNDQDPSNDVIEKSRLRVRSYSTTSIRTIKAVAIANGQMFRKNGTVWASVGSPGDFTTSLRFVHAIPIAGKLYAIDGVNYRIFDPSDNSLAGWTTNAGEIPVGCRLLEGWNDRPILSGNPADPKNWFMGATGDPTDFDYFPSVTKETQAVAGNYSPAGLCPDIINAIVPFADDLLAFGCDHSIQRLTGDPMSGGRFDLVSDVTGMAYGRAWCKDDQGIIYFFGSKGGVYKWPPGGFPTSITEGRRERTFQDIDVAANKIQLAWDHKHKGVHVFITPLVAGATTHYYWNKGLDAWEGDDVFDAASGAHDPTSVHVVDGDASGDRAILLGCHDGYVRKIDYDATDDDGTAIDSNILIGPIQPSMGQSVDAKLMSLRGVLGPDSGKLQYQLYASEEAINIGADFMSGTWTAGRNNGVRQRGRGMAFWIKLSDRSGAAWALESIEMEFKQGARLRNR